MKVACEFEAPDPLGIELTGTKMNDWPMKLLTAPPPRVARSRSDLVLVAALKKGNCCGITNRAPNRSTVWTALSRE